MFLGALGVERPSRLIFSVVMGMLCACAGFAADPGFMLADPRVTNPPEEMNWSALPRLDSEHAVIFRGVENEAAFNLHEYLAYFDGRFWAMWSCGLRDEDREQQHVRYATSIDGLAWSEAKPITEPDMSGRMRYFARGFWVRDSELLALAAHDEVGPLFGSSLRLLAFAWDPAEKTWREKGVVFPDTINNFPPKKLPSGEWMMSRRDAARKTYMIVGGATGIDDWQSVPIAFPVDGAFLEEPFWWTLPDGRLAGVFRDNAKSRRLYRAYSADNGRTWSEPVRTNFPDATSKFNALRLADGRYVLVSNPNPHGRNPLCLSLSRDGEVFTRMAIIRDEPTAPRYEGRAKGAGYHYPHIIEHDDYIYVIYAQNKEDIVVSRIALAELDKLEAGTPFDAAVIGATPGGIAAAVTLARLGHRVALTEYHAHIGGMSASGLGKSDIERREAIGGLFLEFTGRVQRYYEGRFGAGSEDYKLCKDGYYYEPSVAETIFEAMVAEQPLITVLKNHRFESARTEAGRVTAVTLVDRAANQRRTIEADVFIDATYEGDLYAAAGAEFRVGRESRNEYGEPHAGVVYWDYTKLEFLEGTTGAGDDRVQAYTYRLCLTTDPANSAVMSEPPPNYDRQVYLPYIEDLEAGRLGAPAKYREGWGYNRDHFGTLVRALSVTPLPNNKTDVNINPRPLAFPFAEENTGYIEGDWETRERISGRLRDLTLGLLYFLQNDEAVPEEHRAIARQYHLPRDEFTDNGHFPWQLYVREARRLRGLYTISQRDMTLAEGALRSPAHSDSVTAGEFPIDSFPCRKKQPGDSVVLEGYLGMLAEITKPYHIPYRVMIPERVDGLIVPVAVSATHVAYGSIRMEPTWMALGQAAGVAAHLCLRDGIPPRAVPIEELQGLLLEQGQRIAYLNDVDLGDPSSAPYQFLAARGFFEGYEARPDDPLTEEGRRQWLSLCAESGWQAHAEPALAAGTRGEFCRALYEGVMLRYAL